MRFFLLLLLISSAVAAQVTPVSPSNLLDYPDSIKQVTITRQYASVHEGNVKTGGDLGRKVLHFDSQGRLIRELNYSEEGSMYFGTEYIYSADSRRLTQRDVEDTMDIQSVSSFDADGNITRKISLDAGHQETEFYYSATKVLQRSMTFYYDKKDSVEVIKNQTEVEYNSEGQKVKSTYSARYGKDKYDLLSVTFYSYDSLGRLTERKQVDEAGMMILLNKYTYDGAGNLVSESTSFGDSYLNEEGGSTATYSYDARGNLGSERHVTKGDEVANQYETTYNAQGLPVKCFLTSSIYGTSLYTWTYSTLPAH